MQLYTVALVDAGDDRQQLVWHPTTVEIDIIYSWNPRVLNYTHVWADDPVAAVNLAERILDKADGCKFVLREPPADDEPPDIAERRNRYSRREIIEALARNRWRVNRTAEDLGVHPRTIGRYIKRYGIYG